jgi:nucleotide-binding universal stress UspA family protein
MAAGWFEPARRKERPLTNATETASADVVVGVDGTEAALRAVRWAAAEAVRRRSPLRIVHVASYVDLSSPAGRTSPEAARARAILARGFTVARRAEPGLAVHTELIGGSPVRALEEISAGAELLVIGMGGAGGLDEFVLDSVALEVSGQGHCPVVVVRGSGAAAAGAPVVLGVGGDADDPAIGWAFDAANRREVPLVAVHALHQGYRSPEQGGGVLARLERWRTCYPSVEFRGETPTAPAGEALLDWSTRAELIVAGTRARGPAARALLGSTSRALLRHSACPVAVIRPDVARGIPAVDLRNDAQPQSSGR